MTKTLSTARGYKYLVAVRKGLRMLNSVSRVSKLDINELHKVLKPLEETQHVNLVQAMCDGFEQRNYELADGIAELEAIHEDLIPFEARHTRLQSVQKALRLLNKASCNNSNTDELYKILKPLEGSDYFAVATAICEGFDKGSYDTTDAIAELENIREKLL